MTAERKVAIALMRADLDEHPARLDEEEIEVLLRLRQLIWDNLQPLLKNDTQVYGDCMALFGLSELEKNRRDGVRLHHLINITEEGLAYYRPFARTAIESYEGWLDEKRKEQ